MNRLEAHIARVVSDAIEAKVFPGCVVGYVKDGTTAVLPFGQLTYVNDSPKVKEDTVYDLASVTKSIPTSSIILKLIEQNKLHANDKVITYIPEIACDEREQILLWHLLTFTVIFDLPHLKTLASHGSAELFQAIYRAPLKFLPGTNYQYSNTPALLLGQIAERITGKRLDVLADELFFSPLNMTSTTFHPKKLADHRCAPTEMNERGEVHQEVHDESAWALYQEGIIAGHAGLFSTASDLLAFCSMLLNRGTWQGKQYFTPQTVSKMSKELFNNGDFGMSLGWETNQSDYMSPTLPVHIFGKDGFTGTLVLLNPKNKSCLVLLANRTYPKRPESPAPINSVRHQLADLILL